MPSQPKQTHSVLLSLLLLLLLITRASALPSITTQQSTNNLNNNPTTTTTTTLSSSTPTTATKSQLKPFDKCNVDVGKILRIGKDGLISDDSFKLNPKEVTEIISCPVYSAVKIKPKWKDSLYAQQLADDIRKKISVCAWYKDGLRLHRDNGNMIIKSLELDANSVGFISPNDLDEGMYMCTIDYSSLSSLNMTNVNYYFELYPSIEFQIEVDKLDNPIPDLPPQITHPPFPTRAIPGQNVTFTCHHIDTQLSQRVDWFRSKCNASDVKFYNDCMSKFFQAFELTLNERNNKNPHINYMQPYYIDGEDGDSMNIMNITEDKIDTYGCMVSNDIGLDIRTANLTLESANGTPLDDRSSDVARVSPVHQYNHQTGVWLTFPVGIVFAFALFAFAVYFFCFTRYGTKIFKHSPLLKQMVVDESTKEKTGRQHLPKIESPDIYNCKSDENCIYGHYHHKNNLLPSMCSPNIVMEKNLSISSNNYQSDESSSWGKSLSSSGDNSRTFYQHTSNNTATTVPLYDHPPSAGATLPNGTLVQGSCVINPTYGFLRPDFDASYPKCTFSRRNLEPQKIIGKGQFGEVWRYVAHQKDGTASFVAVKKLNVRFGQEQQAKDEILKEIEIMKCVNDHPNVIKFLNTCMEPTKVLLIMEYADNGTLQSYLRKSRYAKDKHEASVTSKELLKYSYHVAKGMEYIASKGIVHRDLATRNILLSKEKTCKIADFGLARFVGDSGIYQRLDRNQPVPIKWMAPESLSEYGTYTSKSDVFSVGVLMWEIVTLGATPYDFLQTNEVLKKVVNGERLSRPEHCKEEFYIIMDRCWHQDPANRPTFKELADDLEVLLQSENDYIQLDKYPEHAYYNINTSINAEKEMVTTLPFYPELDNVFDSC